MKYSRLAAVIGLALGASLWGVAEQPAFAKPPAAGGTGTIEKSMQISPKGIKWGLSLDGVSKLYDKVIEDEMLPLFRKAQPGLELDALTEEQKNRKGALKRSKIDFGATPTGVDQSALKGEYSYNNGESLAFMTLGSGTKRNFFFFSDKLWKIYDEHKLKKGGNLGDNFQEAVKALSQRFGAAAKMVPADYDKGRPFDEAEWRDPDKIIRAVDRGQTLGVVYIDRKVQEELPRYRKNKTVDGPEPIDKDVASVTKKGDDKPEKKPGDKDKGKGKK
ncbi:MAG: hypothetical protein QM756_43540 [Polyangiaceae bacterium]